MNNTKGVSINESSKKVKRSEAHFMSCSNLIKPIGKKIEKGAEGGRVCQGPYLLEHIEYKSKLINYCSIGNKKTKSSGNRWDKKKISKMKKSWVKKWNFPMNKDKDNVF